MPRDPHLMMKTGALLLAAGGSTRLGQAKQLLPIQGEPLIRRTLRTLLSSGVDPVVTVLGAEAGLCAAEIADLGGSIAIHSSWRDGLASSLGAGLQVLQQMEPWLEGVVICLCDQPFLSSSVIDGLIETHCMTGKSLVASRYEDGTLGSPAYYGYGYFEELQSLQGDKGARSLFRKHPEDLAVAAFPMGGMDVDTPEQYATIRAKLGRSGAQRLART